jgi:hypothetical protein
MYTVKQLKAFRQHSINAQTGAVKPSRTNDYDRGHKHGKGKSPYEIMDGPNPDHKPTGLPNPNKSPKMMRGTILPEKIWCQYQYLYNNTPSNVIVNVASNVSCRPLLEITDAGRSHRYMFLQVFL